MKWQPIETAPKDGSDFLALSSEGIYEASVDELGVRPLTLDWHGCGCCGDARPTATHWMPLPAVPAADVDQEEVPEAVIDAVAAALGDSAYDCTRVWSAWSYGTMGPDDFAPIAEDGDRVAEIARAALDAMKELP